MNFLLNKKLIIIIIIPLLFLTIILNEGIAAEFSKTAKFFVLQNNKNLPDGTELSQNFNISISEETPRVASAYLEIKGIAKTTIPSNGIINVKIIREEEDYTDRTYSQHDLILSVKPTKFKIIHDITSLIAEDFPSVPGDKNYTLYILNNNFDTKILNAKLHLTYSYYKPIGNLPISGSVISSIIDTNISDGAGFNSIMWQGNSNGGKVKLQLATSNSTLGPWEFKGPDCTEATYYENDSDFPNQIKCLDHNNQQYFKYKIILCSKNCLNSGTNNPTVNDIIVNWSP